MIDDATREAIIWCPRCEVDKYEVHRLPGSGQGVFYHATIPSGRNERACECGTILVRKP